MADNKRPDLLLLHAPSVFDFRQRAILYGPVSDMVPSSTVFEMYPMGFLTIASYLHDQGMQVRIVNVALRMMNSRHFDLRHFLGRIKPGAIGIDLHWLPHAHGALEVARIAKEVHPNVPVIMGGLSSTYFHRELIQYPQVDYILRGDSTEPPLHQLLLAIRAGASPQAIPNLTWKANGEVHINPLTFLPPSLDYVDLRPDLMVEMVLRYRDLESTLPFNGWWTHPITAVFTVKGCAHQCITCGGSQTACSHLTLRKRPVFRSPVSLVENLTAISRLSAGPILLIGDLLQAGRLYADEVLRLLGEARLPNEIVFEFFDVPPLDYLREIDQRLPRWSLEISPDSHDHDVRRAQDGEPSYTNADLEHMLREALRMGCNRLDVFFMIGLPAQTSESVRATVEYCGQLFQLGDRRLSCFISPMGPFIDPGSRGFEEPERFGYRLFARTLEEHRQLLVQPTWERILNYETKWMTRKQLVDVTYDAAERLNELKLEYGRISPRRASRIAKRIREARDLRRRLDTVGPAENGTIPGEALRGEISRFSVSTVCDKRELFWPRRIFNFRVQEIARVTARYLRAALRAP